MSHLIYSTEAIILRVEDRGEASRLFWLFTERFGLVIARAQGVRTISSKLRYELQPHNLAQVSLVRGREWWRVINVAASDEAPSWRTNSARRLSAIVSQLLLRLVHGEEANTRLFNDSLAGIRLEVATVDLAPTHELLIQLRLLAHLGYVSTASLPRDHYFLSRPWSENLVAEAADYVADLSKILAAGLAETHL